MPKAMPDDYYENDWELESALPDDFDFHITRAYFGYQDEYVDQSGAQVPLLIWEGHSPDVDLERPICWSLGKGWKPVKGGRLVQHEAGKKFFVETSMYGRLIRRVVGRVEKGKVVEGGLFPGLAQRGSAKDASIWEGLGFHMQREEIEFAGLMQEKGGKTSRLMPVKFLGESGKEAGSPAPAAPDADNAEIIAKLEDMARNAASHREFAKLAMRMPEVAGDDYLSDQVVDPGKLWARVRGE